MGQENDSVEAVGKGSHFTSEQRQMLDWHLNGTGGSKKICSRSELARLLGKHRSTIYREIRRGWGPVVKKDWVDPDAYQAPLAQSKAEEQYINHGPLEKIGHDHALAGAIGDKIKNDHYSPYAIVAKFNETSWPGETRLCSKTIYRYIRKNMIGNTSEADLLRQGKLRKTHGLPRKHSRKGAAERSIDKRPETINARSEQGDWEMDTVKGCADGSKECLLTLTERKTRMELIIKLKDARAESVTAVIDTFERTLGDQFYTIFKSITPDNGSEFSDYEGLERSCLREGNRLALYYAHPYRACERGTNENHNGIIRRFFPKGTDFASISREQIRDVQFWMNHYPRKILDGQSPACVFHRLPESVLSGIL